MPFLGTIINFAAIVVFSLLGALLKSRVPERVNRALPQAVAICAIFIGLDGALSSADGYLDTFFESTSLTKFIIVIASFVIGTAIGEIIDIDKWVNIAGCKLERKLSKNKDNSSGLFSQGFVSCTIMTCIGAMSVNGAILDASGDHSILIAKSVMDAITCFVLASGLGIGCLFSAFPVLIYQFALTGLTLIFSAVIPEASIE